MKWLKRAFFFIFIFGGVGLWYASAQAPTQPQIVFTSERDGNREIYVMDADGTHVRNLTHHLADDARPCWSPDGKQIAFFSDRDGDVEIYVMDANGNNQRRLTHHPDIDMNPCWSSDGKQIVFSSNTERDPASGVSNPDIYVMNHDGSYVRRLTEHPGFDGQPRWFDPAFVVSVERRGKKPSIWGRWKAKP